MVTTPKPYTVKLTILDLFVVATSLTILAIRLFLEATGYPQIGGDGLHVAHMLWGGLILGGVLLYSLIADKPHRFISAALGGVGFGFFIDEIGKFVTSDNNYFFKPAAFLIYITILTIWLVARFIVVKSYRGSFLSAVEWPKKRILRQLIFGYAVFQIISGLVGFISAQFGGNDIFGLINTVGEYLAYVTLVCVLLNVAGLLEYRSGQLTRSANLLRISACISLIAVYPFTFYTEQFSAVIGCVAAVLVIFGLSEASIKGLLRSVVKGEVS